uniref:Tryptophan synthase beta chain-like PALP domain-containing protein n=1 Tax=Acrobeloides nanus TaxID=290746 RepID=A0A914CZY2_9BILA
MDKTPLFLFEINSMPEIELYFKNEAQSVTKSLKHRLAWCLYMWALIEGNIQPNRTIYEASSGNSAIAQAYFAQLLGVPYLAIVSFLISF